MCSPSVCPAIQTPILFFLEYLSEIIHSNLWKSLLCQLQTKLCGCVGALNKLENIISFLKIILNNN